MASSETVLSPLLGTAIVPLHELSNIVSIHSTIARSKPVYVWAEFMPEIIHSFRHISTARPYFKALIQGLVLPFILPPSDGIPAAAFARPPRSSIHSAIPVQAPIGLLPAAALPLSWPE